MKLDIEAKPSFEPRILTIVIESQNELDFWGSLFNSSDMNLRAEKFGVEIYRCNDFMPYKTLKKAGADISKTSYFA